jgi:hypothetical protein
LAALRKPFAKNEAVQGPEDQSFWPTGCPWNDANVLRLETVFTDVGQGLGACVDVEGLHGVYFFNPCNLANALAMAEPAPAAGGEV